ncbi:MAG: hypothetical protein LBF50_04955 [Azoarcus sp.]|jgi:hypothetical protein|nr:hypothetical protein [Azoarcus sp.]
MNKDPFQQARLEPPHEWQKDIEKGYTVTLFRQRPAMNHELTAAFL